MRKYKRRLTEQEEFTILKLVLDKFLWLGTILLALGIYNLTMGYKSAILFTFGFTILLLFAWILKTEFEQLR